MSVNKILNFEESNPKEGTQFYELSLLKGLNQAQLCFLDNISFEDALFNAFKVIKEVFQCEGVCLLEIKDKKEPKDQFSFRFVESDILPADIPEFHQSSNFPLFKDEHLIQSVKSGEAFDLSDNILSQKLIQFFKPTGIKVINLYRVELSQYHWGFFGVLWRDSQVEETLLRNEILESFALALANFIDRKQTEQALQAKSAYLSKVIDLNPNYIFAKNLKGEYTLANKAAAEVYGTTPEEMIGKTNTHFNPNQEEIKSFAMDDLQVLMSGETKLIKEETITDSTGRKRYMKTLKTPNF